MPEIPQAVAPTLTPKPEMNPRIAGEPGAVMANAAEQMGSVADYGFQVAKKMQEAKETVDVKMGEVGIDKLEADAHAAMGKATTPEQMQDIQRGFEEQAQEAVNSQKNPKVSRALQFYGAHKSIGIQDLATVRQAKVITENDLAANDMLGTKYSGDYVLAAASGGDTTMAENDERILLASSVKHGTMTQEQADDHFDKWLKASKMDTIGALANSPKPADRQAVIAQLKSGNGPLVDGMNLAERNTTLTAAEHKDHELTEMAGAQDLNGVLNNMHDAFGKFPYTNNGKGDYEAREKALDDGDFLKSIGAVSTDGKPNRVMGDKLQQEVTRQRGEWEKEQNDKNAKAIDKYEPNIAKMTRPQIFQIPDSEIDAHGRSYLLSKWDENYRINRSIQSENRAVNLQERAMVRQERAEKSRSIASDILSAGVPLVSKSDLTPWILKGLSREDANALWTTLDLQKDKGWQDAVKMINASPVYNTATDEGRAKLAHDTLQFARTVQNKKLTGSQITDELQRELHPVEEAQKTSTLKGWLDNVFSGAMILAGMKSSGATTLKTQTTPQRPKGVPPNAVWDEGAKQWQIK